MTFGLQRNVATIQFHATLRGSQLFGVCIALVELRFGVLEDHLAINDVLDRAVAVNFDFDRHPLVAVIRF